MSSSATPPGSRHLEKSLEQTHRLLASHWGVAPARRIWIGTTPVDLLGACGEQKNAPWFSNPTTHSHLWSSLLNDFFLWWSTQNDFASVSNPFDLSSTPSAGDPLSGPFVLTHICLYGIEAAFISHKALPGTSATERTLSLESLEAIESIAQKASTHSMMSPLMGFLSLRLEEFFLVHEGAKAWAKKVGFCPPPLNGQETDPAFWHGLCMELFSQILPTHLLLGGVAGQRPIAPTDCPFGIRFLLNSGHIFWIHPTFAAAVAPFESA